MNLPHNTCIFRLASPCVLALLMFGCSGGSSSSSSDIDGTNTPSDGDTDVVVSGDQESGNAEPVQPDSSSNDGVGNTSVDSSASEPAPAQEDSSDESDPVDVPETVVEDPIVPVSVQVTFDITVPVYQSDQLRVEVDWGDINLVATWIGDEYWSATGEFPLNTQHNVSVTFYDWNGGIELAQFTDPLATAFDTAETIQVAVGDFDIAMFDTDGDGTSNLDELTAGRDPLVDEDAQLPVRDFHILSDLSRMSVSRHMESHIPLTRPISETNETNPRPSQRTYKAIDIDAEGNGTLVRNISYGSISQSIRGIRTVNGNSVSWEGGISARDDYGHSVSVNNTVTYIDENSRSLVEDLAGSNIGTYTDRWETSSSLIGHVIDDGPFCAPVAGTVITTNTSNRGPLDNYTRIVSKELDDPYWRVTTERVDGETAESFARELIMLRSYCGGSCGTYTLSEPEDTYFQCDFVDFED